MSRFTDLIKANAPRFVVEMIISDNGEETFKWGVVGKVPILSMISGILAAQLVMRSEPEGDGDGSQSEGMPGNALVCIWNDNTQDFEVFCGEYMPTLSLIGMLEVIKATLVMQAMNNTSSSQVQMYGPDGQPLRR